MKNFFYKLKKDLIYLTMTYPEGDISTNRKVDYNSYWDKKREGVVPILSSWQKQRADLVLEIIEPGSTVIDFGCGDGAILKYLKDKKNIEGTGIDVSATALKKAEALGLKVIKADINNLDELNNLPEVDYILGFEIIEHMPNPEEFIGKIKNKARRAMIFSIPNIGYFTHRVRLLLGRFPSQWLVHPGEHLRFWTVKDVEWWVKSMNLKLDKVIVYEGLPLLNKLMPKLFGQGIIMVIKK